MLTLHMEVTKECPLILNDPFNNSHNAPTNTPYQQVIQENAELLTEEGRLLQQVGHS